MIAVRQGAERLVERSVTMSRLSWPRMIRAHPAAHLIVGRLPARGARGRAADRQAAHREELFGRLGEAMSLTGNWSVTSIKEEDGLAHAHLAFEARKDADRFAVAIQATAIGRYPGWVSQREFLRDKAAEEATAAAMARDGEIDQRQASAR